MMKKAIYCAEPCEASSAARVALRKLLKDGVEKVLFVFDFDHTLSSSDSAQCHDHLALVDDDIVKREMAQYLDFKNGGHPSLRGKELSAWWFQVHDLLVDRKLTRVQLSSALKQTKIALRPRAKEAIEMTLTLSIPLTVVSAGLEHVIDGVMPFRTCSLDDECVLSDQKNTVHLVANRLLFKDDVAFSVRPDPPVTAANKSSIYARLRPFFDEVHGRGRTKVLLVGDSVGDVRAVENIPKTDLLTIGFFNPENPWSKRDAFDATFDILLPHTASFSWLEAELQEHLRN